jgi:hypothetical protein
VQSSRKDSGYRRALFLEDFCLAADPLAALDAIPVALIPAAVLRLTARLLATPAVPDDTLLSVAEAWAAS